MTPLRSEILTIETLDTPQNTRIFTLTGPLTLQTLFEFQQLGREDHTKPVIVDLTNVPYMDSAGLGCLLGMFASCQRTNRGLAMVGLSDRLRTLFQITHTDDLIPCCESIEDAERVVHNLIW